MFKKLFANAGGCAVLLSIIILINLLLACSAVKVPENQILVKYEIRHAGFASMELEYFTLVPSKTKVIPVPHDTVFYDTVFASRPLYMSINTNESIGFYGEPGSTIEIQLGSGDRLDQRVHFSGDLADMNNYLVLKKELEKKTGLSGEINDLPVEMYLSKTDSIQQAKTIQLNGCKKIQASNPFWKHQAERIQLETVFKNYDFASFYPMNHSDNLSKEWYAKLKPDQSFLLSKPELIIVPEIQSHLDMFMARKSSTLNNKWVMANQQLMKEEGFIKPSSFEFGVNYVTDSVSDIDMRNFLLLKLTQRSLDKGVLKPVANVLRLFYNNSTDSGMISFIRNLEAEYKPLQPGVEGPEIVGFDAKGSKVTLTSLRGKFIIVDVWATWCGPCLGDFPAFKKLMDAYKGKNIIFIKYSIDEDKKRWLEYIQKGEPTGPDCMHLVSENGTECNLLKDYKFSAIPHYLFFDARGRIINIAMDSPGAVLHYKYLDKYLDDPEYQ